MSSPKRENPLLLGGTTGEGRGGTGLKVPHVMLTVPHHSTPNNTIHHLKELPIWVWWDSANGNKAPLNPNTGGGAMSNNPETWGTFEEAQRAAKHHGGGVGFMFFDGLCGIDIDGVGGDPEREKQAQEIIAHMAAYTERSPSGDGYHVVFRADTSKLPEDYKAAYHQKNVKTGVECYIGGKTNRYFTYTGKAVNSRGIEERTGQLLAFLDRHMRKKNPPRPTTGAVEAPAHSDILDRAREARNGDKFSALYDRGDTSQYGGDDSSADIALANILAFYCQGDAATVEELFSQSALGQRDKWRKRADYRAATIAKGIEICSGKFYRPKKAKTKQTRPPKTNPLESKPLVNLINPFDRPERYTWDDLGLRLLFADTFKNVSRYVPEAKEYFVYDGRVWKLDTDGMIVQQQAVDLIEHLLDCRKFLDGRDRENWVGFISSRMKKRDRDTILKDAATVYPVSIMEFDRDPYIFNCQNCTLDLRSFTAYEHRPEDFLSKVSNAAYDPEAACGRWAQFIAEVMRGDMNTARYLQKSLGYALTGDTREECFFILYGSTTRNGKGTTMETTLHLMGDYGRTAQPETVAQKQFTHSGGPSEDIARLKGSRFVNMSEPDKGLRLNNALVKQMTGGDTIAARFLHQNSFEFRPEYKLFINTNHLPRVTDDTIFASGRVKLVPFERHFPESEQDKGLKAFFKQPGNMSGILNWFIEGLRLIQSEGLQQPPAVIAAVNQYREESDTVGLFIRECLLELKDGKTPMKDIHAEYEKWCSDNGYRYALDSTRLSLELRRKGLDIRKATGNRAFVFGYVITVPDSELPEEWRN